MTLPAPGPDRTCLITGASSGIGADLARELAKRGHGVTLVARREGPLRELAAELAGAHAIRAEVAPCDLSDEAAREGLAADVAERGLTVEVLVNNAGFSTMGPVHKSVAAKEIAMIRTDVEAVAHLCSLFLPGMVERGRGAVLNVASTAAFQPLPGQAGYGACKSFVLSYSHAIAQEVRQRGVTVTVLCPGPVETGFAEAMGLSDEEASASLPKLMWETSADVAATAVRALDKGKTVVIPGLPNRIGARFAHLSPRRVLLPLLASRHPSLRD
jgi:short-subunit dehydrogenase